MRLLFDLTSLAYNFSGIERYAENMALQMIKEYNMHEYVLIFKDNVFPEFNDYVDKKNVEIHILKGKNRIIFSQIILPFNLYRYKADFYFFMAFPTPLFFYNKNTISTIHDIGCWDFPQAMKAKSKYYFRILYRKVAIFDSYIMTVSLFSKNRIRKKLHVNSDRIWIIHPAISENFSKFNKYNQLSKIDNSAFKVRYNLPEKYILCLSTLEPRKNLRLLVKAYEELKRAGQLDVDLVLAGRRGWKIDNLLDNVDPAVIEHVHITGFVDEKDLPAVYSCASYFVFPSLYEGFGLPPLEALAVGTTVIASDAASLPEILGEYPLYFKSDNIEDLKLKLYSALNCSNNYMNNEEIMRLIDIYNWKKSSDELNNHLLKIIEGK